MPEMPPAPSPEHYLWDDSSAPSSASRGVYIAIGGNTGLGKSTLLAALARRIRRGRPDTVCVSERVLHHPLLKLMFRDPGAYGFGIQLNFMVQRNLLLRRELSLGRVVVIERSHLDDLMFVQTLQALGHIRNDEYDCYVRLSALLHATIPDPDLYVFIQANPEVSLQRLRSAEEAGERPREFPSDDAKRSLVSRWHAAYEAFYRDLLVSSSAGGRCAATRFVPVDGSADAETVLRNVMPHVSELMLRTFD